MNILIVILMMSLISSTGLFISITTAPYGDEETRYYVDENGILQEETNLIIPENTAA